MKKNMIERTGLILAIIAGLVFTMLMLSPAAWADSPKPNGFTKEYHGTAPVGAVVAEKGLTPGDPSGWFVRLDGLWNGPTNQVNILWDSIGSPWSCFHRISVMGVQYGVGYTRGWGSYTPPTFPMILELYQAPSLIPIGYIEIGALNGATATIGFNRPATGDWVRAAAYSGQSCAPFSTDPNPVNDRKPK